MSRHVLVAARMPSLSQCVEQDFSLVQIESAKTLSEPTVDWSEEITGFGLPASVAPEARKAGRSTKLQHPRTLCGRGLYSRSKTSFALVMPPSLQMQPSIEAVQFCLPPALTGQLGRSERILQ
jgi:hypothetical protein